MDPRLKRFSGKVQEITDYWWSDVINTYRIWLRYELFRGVLSEADFVRSEQFLEVDLGHRGLGGADADRISNCMTAEKLFPNLDLLTQDYVLVQAWKKTSTHIRQHNWYSDTLEFDRAASTYRNSSANSLSG